MGLYKKSNGGWTFNTKVLHSRSFEFPIHLIGVSIKKTFDFVYRKMGCFGNVFIREP